MASPYIASNCVKVVLRLLEGAAGGPLAIRPDAGWGQRHMMLARIPVAAVGAAAAMLISGCAVGPDFEHPPPPEVTRYTPEPLAPRTTATAGVQGGQAQHFINGRDIPGEWWRLFGSRPLNSLVQKSLIANPNLQAAQAALRQAQEMIAAQKGKFFPSADASFTPTRQQQSGALGAVTSSPATIFNLYTAQVAVTYTLDVWGGIAARSNRCRRRRITSASWWRPPTSRSVPTWSWRRSRRRRCAARSRPPTNSSTSIRRCSRSCAASSWRAIPIAATSPPRRRRWPRSRRPCRRCARHWPSSAIFFPLWRAGFQARSRWRRSGLPPCNC